MEKWKSSECGTDRLYETIKDIERKMKRERKCGKCKHYKPCGKCKEIGRCNYYKDGGMCLYGTNDDCDIREPNGFEPKEGEQE